MVRGTLDIQKLSNPGSTRDVYQVHFEDLAGNTYDASMSDADLEDVLHNKLRLDMEIDDLHACINQLRRTGRVTLEDIVIAEAELLSSGLKYLPYAG